MHTISKNNNQADLSTIVIFLQKWEIIFIFYLLLTAPNMFFYISTVLKNKRVQRSYSKLGLKLLYYGSFCHQTCLNCSCNKYIIE